MAPHRLNVDDAATAGTVGFHQEEKMVLNTSSEVVGNTARGNSSMFNADVHRRTVNQSGTFRAEGNHLSPAGGAVYFHVHLNTDDSKPHARTAGLNTGMNHGPLECSSQRGQFRINDLGEFLLELIR